MIKLAASVKQKINQGLKLHKKGDDLSARLLLQAALRDDPDNIVALLWLAYLATSHEKRVFIFNRVLDIDPDNERAKAGLAWAKRIASVTEGQNIDADSNAQANIPPKDPPAIHALKKKFGTNDLKKQAQKNAIAQRVRRRIGS